MLRDVFPPCGLCAGYLYASTWTECLDDIFIIRNIVKGDLKKIMFWSSDELQCTVNNEALHVVMLRSCEQ